jgi:nitroreductase
VENKINKIIKERRSIYPQEYNGEIIEQNVIEVLLENAHYAPNHLSNYPWRYIVLQDQALHAWLDRAAEIYKSETEPEKFKQQKYEKVLAYKTKVSHAIAIVMHREKDSKSLAIEDICAVAASVQNIYLSLSQYDDIGGYWSTGLGTYSKLMHGYLNLSEEDLLMGFFVLGKVNIKRTEGSRGDFRKFVRFF